MRQKQRQKTLNKGKENRVTRKERERNRDRGCGTVDRAIASDIIGRTGSNLVIGYFY